MIFTGGFANTRSSAILLIGAAIALLLHAFYYYPYFVDDAYISLRYARHFMEGRGLTWNDGEYVEGYSNLLWVLLTAALGYIGSTFPPPPGLSGLCCTLLLPFAIFRYAEQTHASRTAFIAGLIVCACTPAIAIWAMAGMETPLVMLLLTWAVIRAHRLLTLFDKKAAYIAGILLGTVCLLRPEGPVYTIAVAIAFLLCSSLPRQDRFSLVARMCIAAALFFLGQLAFRLCYYGGIVPNTVLAKTAFSEMHLKQGVLYTANTALTFLPLLLYTLINLSNAVRSPEPSDRCRLFSPIIIIILAVAVTISGGDIFPGFRAFAPLIPLLAFAVMDSVAIGFRITGVTKETCFLIGIFLAYMWVQSSVLMNQRPKHSLWELNAEAIGQALKQRYSAAQPLIAVYTAGAVPFYSDLPAFDVLGLTDRYLTQNRYHESRFGSGLIGHELFDGAYIKRRHPDILVLNIPALTPSPCDVPEYRDECKILLSDYRPETLEIPGYTVPIWLRKDSTKVK